MDDLTKLQKLDKREEFDTPEAKDLAQKVYDNGLPSHQCYWNDRLYIAFKFGLDEERKKKEVLNSILRNGCQGCFEQDTHHGFDNRKLFEGGGIPVDFVVQSAKRYCNRTIILAF